MRKEESAAGPEQPGGRSSRTGDGEGIGREVGSGVWRGLSAPVEASCADHRGEGRGDMRECFRSGR